MGITKRRIKKNKSFLRKKLTFKFTPFSSIKLWTTCCWDTTKDKITSICFCGIWLLLLTWSLALKLLKQPCSVSGAVTINKHKVSSKDHFICTKQRWPYLTNEHGCFMTIVSLYPSHIYAEVQERQLKRTLKKKEEQLSTKPFLSIKSTRKRCFSF